MPYRTIDGTLGGPAKLGLVFATMQRPHTAQRLINSVRAYFPEMPIYVADQSEPTDEMRSYYARTNCEVAWMDFDVGVCASRNAAVAMVKEPYFILCDDDFYFGPETNFDTGLKILDSTPDIGIVGGRLFDRFVLNSGTSTGDRFWELLFNYDRDKGKLLTVPVHYFAPEPQYAEGVEYFECDAVMNFAVFRTDIFEDCIQWDPRFKSNGEHEDFYLNFKMNGKHRVVYTPTIVAYHNHPVQPKYQKFRFRNDGWQKFMEKWQLRQFLELDGGLRVTNMVHEVQRYAIGYKSFYNGTPLGTTKKQTPAGSLRISNITGRIISDRSKLDNAAETRLKGSVHIDTDDNANCVGGSWEFSPPSEQIKKAVTRKPMEFDPSLLEFDANFPVGYRNDHDAFCYLQPKFGQEDIYFPFEIEGMEIYYSIALGSDYLVYLKPALVDSQKLYANQWNALLLDIPPVARDLCVEISVINKGEPLFSASQLVSFTSRRCPRRCCRKAA